MTPTTLIELEDLRDAPRVKMTLPCPLRLGDRITLDFVLKRFNRGRHEVLMVKGDYRITEVHFDPQHQYLKVTSLGVTPSWQAVKKTPVPHRGLGPSRFPPTTVS